MSNSPSFAGRLLSGWDEENRQWEAEGLRRVRRTVIPGANGQDEIDGRRLWNYGTNDYLGLARHPQVIAAAIAALEKFGAGARSSALIVGRTERHAQLESRLTAFEGSAATLLFPSGYAANSGVVSALATSGDLIFCDRLNHASLVEGCRLSGARLRVFPHCDIPALAKDLAQQSGRRKLIVTDSVFSMDGDWAPLPALCELAERHQALLIVDEAHATGIYGPHGRGLAELLGVENRCLRIGTLSKALGAQGGFVTGDHDLIDGLWHRCRPQMFSTALTPAACAAAIAALDLVRDEPRRRVELLERSQRFVAHLQKSGLLPDLVREPSPIIPIPLQTAERSLEISAKLAIHGFFVPAIRPPTVPRGSSRLRISLSWAIPESVDEELMALLTSNV